MENEDNIVLSKAEAYAIRIIKLYRYLQKEKNEKKMSSSFASMKSYQRGTPRRGNGRSSENHQACLNGRVVTDEGEANEHPAQGNALGRSSKSDFRPERANLGAARANKLVCLAESRQDKTKSKALQSVADAFKFPSEWNAFALSGRKMMCGRDTQGAALGWWLSALSGRSSLSGLVFFTSET